MPYPAKPTALKKLQGNPGHRPLNKREPQFKAEAPRCPGHLGPIAKREWHRIVKELLHVGLLTLADRSALAAYCHLYGRWIQLEQELSTVQQLGSDRGLRLMRMSNAVLDGMRKYLTEFGLTPSSRARLQVMPAEKEKTLEEQIRDAVSGLEPEEAEVKAGVD